MELPSFLSQTPPPGYIPGIGRGAVGFSTKEKGGERKTPARNGANSRRLTDTIKDHTNRNKYTKDPLEDAFQNQDEEEVNMFKAIEEKLKNKGRYQDNEDSSGNRIVNVSSNFADLKRSLGKLSQNDWLNIPEASDITRRNKRTRIEEQLERKTYSAPDSLFQSNINLSKLTEERERLLALEIDKTIHTKSRRSGELIDLDTLSNYQNSFSSASLEEIRRNRKILASYRKSHPRNAENWISSARLEEKANQYNRAKKLLEEGCKMCPKSEEIWLEYIRISHSDEQFCKLLVSTALRHNIKSENLWIKAIELEQQNINKIKLVRKALLNIPSSARLWELAVSLEDSKEGKLKVLSRAVELVPDSPNIWLYLIKLQSIDVARQTLRRAENYIKDKLSFWIIKCQIEEENSTDFDSLVNIFINGYSILRSQGTLPAVHESLKEALFLSDQNTHPSTPKAIIVSLVNDSQIDTETNIENLLKILSHDLNLKATLFSSFLQKYPSKYSIWREFTKFAEENNMKDVLFETYNNIVVRNPENIKTYPVLLLMYAKSVWNWGEKPTDALRIIDQAISVYPTFKEFWLAKFKILNGENTLTDLVKCFKEFQSAIKMGDEQVVIFFIKCLQNQNSVELSIKYIEEALRNHPEQPELYILKSQVHLRYGNIELARSTIFSALEKFDYAPAISIFAGQLEMQHKNWEKARSILNISLSKNPRSESLFEALILMEMEIKDDKQVVYLINQGLKACPASWKIWSLRIRTLDKKYMRKTIFHDALKATKEHPMVLCEIGRVFLNESQFPKAHKWIIRSVEMNPQYGDPWVWLYICESYLEEEKTNAKTTIAEKITKIEPKFGTLWEAAANSYEHISDSPVDILKSIIKEIKV